MPSKLKTDAWAALSLGEMVMMKTGNQQKVGTCVRGDPDWERDRARLLRGIQDSPRIILKRFSHWFAASSAAFTAASAFSFSNRAFATARFAASISSCEAPSLSS